MSLKIGVEMELHVIDAAGALAPRADDILAERAGHRWTHECALSMIEVHSAPCETMHELDASLRSELKAATRAAERLGLRLMPSSTIGGEIPLPRSLQRYRAKEVLLAETRPLEYQIAGTHVHVDKIAPVHEQFNLFTQLDPLFAAVSSTPFLAGRNGANCHRVETYRMQVFKEFPEYGSLLGFFGSEAAIEERFTALYHAWLERLERNGLSGEGFTARNTYWGPVRLSERTVEARSLDATDTSLVLAAAAVYLGASRRLARGVRVPVTSFEQLKELERHGIEQGVADPQMRAYLSRVLRYAREGLSVTERRYLDPISRTLERGENRSDQIRGFAEREGMIGPAHTIDPTAVPRLRASIADDFERDLHGC